MVMEPRSFDEMPKAIQALRERKTIILNLTMMEPDQAQRAVDFVAGGTFAIDGQTVTCTADAVVAYGWYDIDVGVECTAALPGVLEPPLVGEARVVTALAGGVRERMSGLPVSVSATTPSTSPSRLMA